MQSKSVFEIFSNATTTFGRSFWSLMTTYWFALTLIVAVSWLIGQFYSLPWNIKNPLETIQLLPIMSPRAYTILGILGYIVGYVFSVWQVLIVKNNLFDLNNSVSTSFKESVPKTILITFCTLIIGIILFPTVFVIKQLFPFGLNLLPLVILLFAPIIIIFYLGLILEEGKLKDVIVQSLGSALTGYFKTLAALIIFVIGEILIAFILFGLFFLFRVVTLFMSFSVILLLITIPIMYVVLQSFAVVYFVETYYAVAVDYEARLTRPKKKKEEPKPKEEKKEKKEDADFLKGMRLLGEDLPAATDKGTDDKKTTETKENKDKKKPSK